ncbi:MAG TPA: allantoate amidohydrolase, partial [Ktedonobacterales bacterium]
MTPYSDSARLVMERCDILGAISEEPDRLTRRYGTAQMRQANAAVAEWMRAAGMQTRSDAIGNLIGRYEGSSPDAKTFLLGSHLDTVRDAGKYDGPLGVMVALACVERLHARGERLPFALEVYAFADEEGLRYRTLYLGSSVVAGIFDSAALAREDSDGIPLEQTIRVFGGDPDHQAASARRPDELLGYAEVHIEQGPVLEERGYPVGVVSAIQGQIGVGIEFTGEAGHAGTVPMTMRHDALAAAAEFTLAVEALGQQTPGLVATVGRFQVAPGASNVIPGLAELSLDVRHPENNVRLEAVDKLHAQAESIAQRRGVQLDWRAGKGQASVACSPHLMSVFARAVAEAGYPVITLASGAGHDAAIMAQITEIAMLFVRCARG